MSTDAIVLLKNDHIQAIGAEMEGRRADAPRRPSQPSALKKTIDAVVT